ncbi:MAG: efflux RND transporter periplasmic adaptor subunit [Desulfuromusa sp.]|jgi:RND family efflux transporter MFP subunit|nr:efflux RND transporter periplasmic adaptor subunit [Desulfuromusa sp.]
MLRITFLLMFCLTLLTYPPAFAEDNTPKKQQGPPPMLVEVAPIIQGEAEPMVERIGTVHYVRASRIASELSGLVEKVHFTEGSRVKAGQPLIQLRSDLLKKAIEGTRANYEQIQIEQEHAQKGLNRIKALFEEKSVSESVFDDSHYKVLGLEKRAVMLKATLDRQLLELEKTVIRAPFSGLVQKKSTEQGEWIPTGGQIALIADDRELEVYIDVPQQQLSFLKKGDIVPIRCADQQYSGEFSYVIPQGDISTRTFTIKLKLKASQGLIAGMEAYAQLPNGPKQQSLLVPRDAVIKQFGQDVLFVAVEGKAKMIPVLISGYQGMQTAVSAPGLTEGMLVVVKGNERIRDGQAIRMNQ